MAVPLKFASLADAYKDAAQVQALQNQGKLRDLQIQQALEQQKRQASLRDMISKAYTPESYGTPTLPGITESPYTPASLDMNKVAMGAAQMGDLPTAISAQNQQQNLSSMQDKAMQNRIDTMQKFVDAGDAQGALEYAKTHPGTPPDAQIKVDPNSGAFTLLSPSTGIEHTIMPSIKAQHQMSYDKWASRAGTRGAAGANTIQAKIAAVKQLDLDPEEEAAAIKAVVGAGAKPVDSTAASQKDIAAARQVYETKFPKTIVGDRPKGAMSFEDFYKTTWPTIKGGGQSNPLGSREQVLSKILQANPGRNENDPEVQALLKKYGY